ncbi:ribonuclease H-like domain-containing protein [Tanacetum coccineum]
MIAIRMKKFYKKTRRRVRIDGNKPVGFDKKKLECFKCHNTGHFARECTSKGTNDGKKRDSFYQDQGAGKKEQNQNCLLTMDDGVVNWGEHTVEEEETNHALMAISSNNEVSLCSKTCIDSYNKLKTLCDDQMNQLGKQEAKILAYTLAVKKLEAQVVTFQKQQLSLNEQLTFQANEIYAKDEKLKKYRRIGMKVVKEKEQLKKTVDSWKNSSKNLWKLVDSGMTSNSKVGLGYEIQSNNEGPQKPEISDSDDNSTEHSTCQSNDSEGSFGNPSKHSSESESESISVPNEMSTSKSVYTNEKLCLNQKKLNLFCNTLKTPRQQMKNQGTLEVKGKNWNKMMERELGEGYFFIKKKCFVCGSLSHLIKDCDFYEKKMAREAELKKQRVFTTGNGVAKPVWKNANRVNRANHFIPRPVQLNTVRQNVNSVRPNVNTGRANVNSVKTNVNSVRHNVNSVRTNVNTGRSKQPVPTNNTNSFSPVRPQDHPLKNMEDRGIFDSGCSGHMTGNKDHLDDFEECKGGSVTFGGSKGYITEKPNVKGVGYRWIFDIDYLTDSMNYIPVSLENQTNPHAGTLEVTNSACTLQTPNANASEEEDEAEELIVVPTVVKHTAAKVGPRKSSTNSKAEEEVPKNKGTSTTSVNSGSGPVNTQHADQDDSDMLELTIFNKPQKGIFDEASYDDEGMVHDFNNLPTEVAVSPIPTLRIPNIHPQSQILGDPKSSVQTRSRVQQHSGAHALVSYVQKQQRNNHKDQQHFLFACFLSQEEPKKISKALKDDS